MILYFIKTNIKRKENSKILNFLICTIVVSLSYKIFNNNTMFNNYSYKIYPYFCGALITIFAIITIIIFIKKGIDKNKKAYNKNK